MRFFCQFIIPEACTLPWVCVMNARFLEWQLQTNMLTCQLFSQNNGENSAKNKIT
jgi:hypothetical protein